MTATITRLPTPRRLFIYVIGEGRGGPMKIGTTDDPEKRVRELQIGNPRQLKLYRSAACPMAKSAEAWLHRRLAEFRLRGEWFDVGERGASLALERVMSLWQRGLLGEQALSENMRVRDGNTERRCCVCRRWKPLSSFHAARRRKIGYQGRCKLCSRKGLFAFRRSRRAA